MQFSIPPPDTPIDPTGPALHYVHVKPVGDPVTQGQQIGVTDNSGCQSGDHIHMARKDPNNSPVNFTVPVLTHSQK
jgi:hypothetical protein